MRQCLLCAALRHAMTVDSDDDDSDSGNSDYQFSTPDGLRLARKILRPLLPYDPHDDQLGYLMGTGLPAVLPKQVSRVRVWC